MSRDSDSRTPAKAPEQARELLPVTKEDRKTAALIVRCGAPGVGNGNKVVADRIKGGLHDDYLIVQRVAAHRLASIDEGLLLAAEIARSKYRSELGTWSFAGDEIADAIEAEIGKVGR